MMMFKELLKKEWRITRLPFLICLAVYLLFIAYGFLYQINHPDVDAYLGEGLIFIMAFTIPVFLLLFLYSLLIDSSKMKRFISSAQSMRTTILAKLVNVGILYIVLKVLILGIYVIEALLLEGKIPGWTWILRVIIPILDGSFLYLGLLPSSLGLLIFSVYHAVKYRIGKISAWIVCLFGFASMVMLVTPPYYIALKPFEEFLYKGYGLLHEFMTLLPLIIVSFVVFALSIWILDRKVEA